MRVVLNRIFIFCNTLRDGCILFGEYMYLSLVGRVWEGSISKSWMSSEYWRCKGVKLGWSLDRDWLQTKENAGVPRRSIFIAMRRDIDFFVKCVWVFGCSFALLALAIVSGQEFGVVVVALGFLVLCGLVVIDMASRVVALVRLMEETILECIRIAEDVIRGAFSEVMIAIEVEEEVKRLKVEVLEVLVDGKGVVNNVLDENLSLKELKSRKVVAL